MRARHWPRILPDTRRRARALPWALVSGLLFLNGSALAQTLAQVQDKSDWETKHAERNWQEGVVALPPYPVAQNLLEFFVSAATSFRFFIDGSSVSVGPDRVVRYTLVARSAEGVENVSFEGMRCSAGTYRIYATGRRDGVWSTARLMDWRPIQVSSVARWHDALRREYFCPGGVTIVDAQSGVSVLREGGRRDP